MKCISDPARNKSPPSAKNLQAKEQAGLGLLYEKWGWQWSSPQHLSTQDVVQEGWGSPEDFFQVKHHINSFANLLERRFFEKKLFSKENIVGLNTLSRE